jgi:hypothetical protein
MGGSVNNPAAAPNFQSTQAPVDPGIMQFAQQQFAGADMGGRDQYQAELVNQLRANSYQNPESVWGSVQSNQANAAQAQQSQQNQELNDFLATAPQQPVDNPTGNLSPETQGSVWQPSGQYVHNGDSDGYTIEGGPQMTIAELRAAGKAPTGQGQWMQYVHSAGGDAGGSYYAPYQEPAGNTSWYSGDGG